MTRHSSPPPGRRPSLAHPSVLLATWFGAGYLPVAPGTWGSLVAVPCAAGLLWAGDWPFLAVGIAVTTLLGIWAGDSFEQLSHIKDPGPVVIDEVAGQWLTILPLAVMGAALDPVVLIVAFLLFRLFDVTKPWPIRQLEHFPRGVGIMLDDLLAGVYAMIVLVGIAYAAGWIAP